MFWFNLFHVLRSFYGHLLDHQFYLVAILLTEVFSFRVQVFLMLYTAAAAPPVWNIVLAPVPSSPHLPTEKLNLLLLVSWSGEKRDG